MIRYYAGIAGMVHPTATASALRWRSPGVGDFAADLSVRPTFVLLEHPVPHDVERDIASRTASVRVTPSWIAPGARNARLSSTSLLTRAARGGGVVLSVISV